MIALSTGYMIIYVYIFFYTDYNGIDQYQYT